jgi:hypothetical protein
LYDVFHKFKGRSSASCRFEIFDSGFCSGLGQRAAALGLYLAAVPSFWPGLTTLARFRGRFFVGLGPQRLAAEPLYRRREFTCAPGAGLLSRWMAYLAYIENG